MNWRDELLDRLAEQPCCGYAPTGTPATEPSCLAALALAGAGRPDGCVDVANWLLRCQSENGSVGVREGDDQPCWPTSLAMLTWLAAMRHSRDFLNWQVAVDRAVKWAIEQRAVEIARGDELGHDTSLTAWPWVAGTSAWIEPTALCVIALKAAGHGRHTRTREAVRMLIDRQLPRGGCNYGNTTVLGNTLRPHLQPTGIACLALAAEPDPHGRIKQSLLYLQNTLSEKTATSSLCWSLLALAAHGRSPERASDWLEGAYHRTMARDRSPLKLALIALASQREQAFVVQIPKQTSCYRLQS